MVMFIQDVDIASRYMRLTVLTYIPVFIIAKLLMGCDIVKTNSHDEISHNTLTVLRYGSEGK